MKRRILSALLAMVLAAALALPAVAAEYPVTVTLDGVPIQWTDAAPYIDENGRTMVPLRPVAEAMGLEVDWDEDLMTAGFGKRTEFSNRIETRLVAFAIGDTEAVGLQTAYYPNGESEETYSTREMDTVPVLKDGRTYAPLRYLAEYFRYDIEWDDVSFTVSLSTPVGEYLYFRAAQTQNYDLLIEFFPGELYHQVYGGEIRNVTLNGVPVSVKQFSQAEINAANAAFGAERVALAFAIEQPISYGGYFVTWEFHRYGEDGMIAGVQPGYMLYTLTEDGYSYIVW